jgi:AAHS family 4-hydroxybenzoate transporter-like MFS transporter
MIPPPAIDVSARIDAAPVGAFQWRIVMLCALVALFDGFDIQAMALVAPTLRNDWGLDVTALGPVLSASLAGMMIGMIALAPLGDRYGRRTLLLAGLALVGVAAIATGFAQGLTSLMLLRFITGLGIGACLPNATALTSEYVPAPRRAFFVTMMYSAVPLGAVVGGWVAGPLIAAYGWPAVFFAGGAGPLLLGGFIAMALPESVRFLASRPGQDAQVATILSKIAPGFVPPADARFVAGGSSGKASARQLFTDGRALLTVMLWTVFFFSLFGMYMLASWLPTVFAGIGWEMADAIRTVSWFWLGGIIGGLVAGALIDRYGAYRVLVPGFVVAAACTAAIGLAVDSTDNGVLVLAVVLIAGFGVVGAQLAMTALAADLYPTMLRSTGIGWGLGVGRMGAVISPIAGGFALAAGWTQSATFAAAAVPPLVCAVGTFIMARAAATHAARAPAAPDIPLPQETL